MTNTAQKIAAHTPGPWINEGRVSDSDSRLVIAEENGDSQIAIVGHEDADVEEANARLIAAAPELLAALREMVESLADFHDHPNGKGYCLSNRALAAFPAARAALAKVSP